MARAAKLKVYRTVAGFADAYVAAPSQKAALAAWGSDKDLFARGLAEIVTDPDLVAAPLATPGEVVRRSRGSKAEQMAALPDAAPKRHAPTRAAPKRAPKPDRARVDAAETALERAKADADTVAKDFAERGATLARERRDAEREARDRVRAAEAERDARQDDYDAALARWHDDAD